MKKLSVILFLAVFLFTGCLTFSTIKGEQGKYQTIEMDKNSLEKTADDRGFNEVEFNLKKTYSVSKSVYSAIITYEYPGKAFEIRDPKGVMLTLNGKYKFYLTTRIKPVDSSQLISNGGKKGEEDFPGTFYERLNKGLGLTTTKIVAEYFLTPKQLKWLMQAGSIKLTLFNKNIMEGVPKTQEMIFSAQNISNIREFYSKNR